MFRIQGSNIDRSVPLSSCRPEAVADLLDLGLPELEPVKRLLDGHRRQEAMLELLRHYRRRHARCAPGAGGESAPPRTGSARERGPIVVPSDPAAIAASIRAADAVVERTFQFIQYPPARYVGDMDWEWDPPGDIEWVAGMYRFPWVRPLAVAFALTGEARYPRAFVELVSDWVRKHPLETWTRTHPMYTFWEGFAWLDIQTGIRASNLCDAFPFLVHADAFTPEFLAILLASLHDHERKTLLIPLKRPHNKTVFELKGFAKIAAGFPEYAESRSWREHAVDRLGALVREQVTPDGVQREWSFGYHVAVVTDALDIWEALAVPEPARHRGVLDDLTRMMDYAFAMTTPELGCPMFGDAPRVGPPSPDRRTWAYAGFLERATEFTGDAKYCALARLDHAALPPPASAAFADAGMVVFRDGWGTDQLYCPFHCSPPGVSSHDQPDNGTFELYANGRWLMPDSGFYTYGHDDEKRSWHRQTRVHQTMTVDRADTSIAGRLVCWSSGTHGDAVVLENQSYPDLLHRRTVWFVARKWLVLLDEAAGDCPGAVELHFQLAAGGVETDAETSSAWTCFPDTNVLVWQGPESRTSLLVERGWHAWEYGSREERFALAFRASSPAPAAFVTLVAPFPGTRPPAVRLERVEGVEPGNVAVRAEVNGEGYLLRRTRKPGAGLSLEVVLERSD